MLQVLLAFLAISIVSATGYGLIEQLSLQQVMVDQRENSRRLNIAADAIVASLVSVPGEVGAFAPAPLNASGWSQIPAGIGGIKKNVDGVPFLYCPVAPRSAVPGSPNFVNFPNIGSVQQSYRIEVKSGAVVGSDLIMSSAVAAYEPVAFIVSASRNALTPPRCSDIIDRNGRPFIQGGIVKAVSRPGNISGPGSLGSLSNEVTVSPTGTSIDDALRQWLNQRPAVMNINIVGNVEVADRDVWNSFVAGIANSSSKITFTGNEASLSAPAGIVNVPAFFAVVGGPNNFTFGGPTFVVNQGDEFISRGNVFIATGAIPGVTGSSGFYIEQGGRLNVSNGSFVVSGASSGIDSAGDITINSAVVSSVGAWSVAIKNGGRISSNGSTIGNSLNTTASLVVSGAWSVSSDAASRVVLPSSGFCWSSLSSDDVTFLYSANGAGALSSVSSDPVRPTMSDPVLPAEEDAYQEWRRQIDGRQRARQTNHSNFSCN